VTPERVEVITSVERRRHWSVAEKLRLVALSYRAAGGVAEVADRAGVHRSLLQRWRSQARRGELVEQRIGVEHFVPVAVHGDDRGAAAMAGVPAPGFPPHVPRALVEIELPNGCRLRVEPDIPAATLRRIIGVLVRR
jgi:transposase